MNKTRKYEWKKKCEDGWIMAEKLLVFLYCPEIRTLQVEFHKKSLISLSKTKLKIIQAFEFLRQNGQTGT